jgi:glucokinase
LRHLGLDLGATYVKWVVLEEDEIVADGKFDTRAAQGPDAVVGRLVSVGAAAGAVDTVGIGVPGLFDAERGVATFLPNLPGDWKKVPLTARVGDALGAPAALINDARAFALAESTLGAGRGRDTAIFVAVGTGVGGGITVGGRFHEGRSGRAGEIGHLTIAEKGPPCTCGNRGCLEAFVREALAARRLRRAGQLLGIGVANAIVLLAPDLVVVGGGVGSTGERLLGPIRQEVARRVHVSVPVEIVQAALGVRAGAVGAALRGAAIAP